MTYQPPPGLSQLQLEHERRQRVEPDHDDSSCVCCCFTCDPEEQDPLAGQEVTSGEAANG